MTSSVLNPQERNTIFGVPTITKVSEQIDCQLPYENYPNEQSGLETGCNTIENEIKINEIQKNLSENTTETKEIDVPNMDQELIDETEKNLIDQDLEKIPSSLDQKIVDREQVYAANFTRCLEKQRFKDPERSYRVYPKICSQNFRKRLACFDFREKTKVSEKEEPN